MTRNKQEADEMADKLADSPLVDAVCGPVGVPDAFRVVYGYGFGADEIDRVRSLGFEIDMVNRSTDGEGVDVWWKRNE